MADSVLVDTNVLLEATSPKRRLHSYRLTGGLLAVVFDGHPFTDPQGFMVLNGLPRAPVKVLAWERGAHAQGTAGELDSLAHEIPFPWPAQVEIPVVR